jgi:hypothetical protein
MSTDRSTGTFHVSNVDGNGRTATLVVTSSRGYSRNFDVTAGNNQSFDGSQDVGWSTSVSFSAHLEPKGGQKRGNSDTATDGPQTTMAKPNPVASFGDAGVVGGTGAYKDWHYVNLHLTEWNPGSTVHCSVGATVNGLSDWYGNFRVDGNGNWGRNTLNTGNSSGNLMVHNTSDLPDGSSCSQQ